MGFNQLKRQIIQQRMLNNLRDIPAMGNIYYVFNSSDSHYDEFEKLVKQTYSDGSQSFHTSLESAYEACVSGRNDVILLDGGSSHVLSNGIDWTKSRINVIGMDGGGRLVQQGAKVTNLFYDETDYLIKVTGIRNSFRNVKFIQNSTEATALTVLQEGGEGSLYENCSFVFGVVDNLDDTTAHEVLAGSDSANFINCTFGSDTLLTSAARSVFHIDQVTTGQEFKSNILKNCNFYISSSSATASFVRLDAIGDILFTNLFDNCNFVASVDSAGGIAMTEAVQSKTGTIKGSLSFAYPRAFNVTNFAVATSGRNTAVQVVAPTSVATTFKGITPTA